MTSQSLTVGERQLWLNVLLQAVKDAMSGHDHDASEEEMRLRIKLSRAGRIKLAKGQKRWREIHRARARIWLEHGINRYDVAHWAGYEPDALDRLVRRMKRNGWKPIGIELGIEIDKAEIRDRRELGIGP